MKKKFQKNTLCLAFAVALGSVASTIPTLGQVQRSLPHPQISKSGLAKRSVSHPQMSKQAITPNLLQEKVAPGGGGGVDPTGVNSDPCNLLPNSSFNEQTITGTTLSGSFQNVFSSHPAALRELAAWRSANGSTPDYFATNSPYNTNPLTTSLGAHTPYNYVASGSNNGAAGLYVEVRNDDPGLIDEEYLTTDVPITVTKGGEYYAAFRAYRSSISTDKTKLGMNLTPYAPGYSIVTTNYRAVFTRSTTSIESPGFVENSSWTSPTSLISGRMTLTPGQYEVNIGNINPYLHYGNTTTNPGVPFAYYFIDEVQLYRIPTAGTDITCGAGQAQGVTLGEGCALPGASYSWQRIDSPTSMPVVGNTLNITVIPTPTTIRYKLTVTLPDGTTSVSYVQVTGCPPPCQAPDEAYLHGYMQGSYNCTEQDWEIVNYNSGWTYSYATTPGTTITPDYYGSGTFRVTNTSGSPTSYTVTITATNCGISTPSSHTMSFSSCRSIAPPAFAVYPNPASSEVVIEQPGAVNRSGQVVSVRIYDNYGKLRLEQKGLPGSSLRVNVQSLPTGLYNLHIIKGGEVVSRQQIQIGR